MNGNHGLFLRFGGSPQFPSYFQLGWYSRRLARFSPLLVSTIATTNRIPELVVPFVAELRYAFYQFVWFLLCRRLLVPCHHEGKKALLDLFFCVSDVHKSPIVSCYGRLSVLFDDIQEPILKCLPHRRTRHQFLYECTWHEKQLAHCPPPKTKVTASYLFHRHKRSW